MNIPSTPSTPKRQLLRHAILLQLEAACPASLPIETLSTGISLAGHKSSAEALLKELSYLEEKQMLSSAFNCLSPAITRYKLTAVGRDYLETQGLA